MKITQEQYDAAMSCISHKTKLDPEFKYLYSVSCGGKLKNITHIQIVSLYVTLAA